MQKTVVALILVLCLGAVAQVSDDVDPDWQTEMDLFNRFADAQDYAGAYLHAQKSLEIAKQRKLDVRSFAGSDYAMAWALFQQEKYPEAEQLGREALRLRESVLPSTHFRVLQSVHQLAETLYAEQKYDEADPLFVRSIAGWDAITDRDGPTECSLGVARVSLGYIRLRQQKYDESQKLLLSAVDSWQQTGAGCGEMHEMWDHIAWLYQQQGHPEKVEAAYQQVIRDLEAADEQDDKHYFHYTLELGDLYAGQKRYPEAETLFKKTLAAADSPQMNPLIMEHALKSYRALLLTTGRASEAAKIQAQLDAMKPAPPESGQRQIGGWPKPSSRFCSPGQDCLLVA